MRLRLRALSTLAAGCLALAGAGLVGCSTVRPVPTERQGLLERIAHADHSRKSGALAGVNRGPAARAAGADRRMAAVEIRASQLRWPLARVEVTSPYGKRHGEFHEGIDLRAKTGTSVYAAQEGTVIYAGSKIRGYGRMVVIRHFNEVSTVYAHNSRLLVRVGQYVRQGQRIAISGNSGRSRGPHLHFEIRDGLSSLDPLQLLPSVRTASSEDYQAAPRVGPLVQAEPVQAVVKPELRANKKKARLHAARKPRRGSRLRLHAQARARRGGRAKFVASAKPVDSGEESSTN